MDKPFALFVMDDYYPHGGFEDFRSSYATLDEALAEVSTDPHDDAAPPWHVVDLRIMKIVATPNFRAS